MYVGMALHCLPNLYVESNRWGDVGRRAFHSGDHVLDLHEMSLSNAQSALAFALEDAKQNPRTLLIVTGQGKHSKEPTLKAGVASMLDQLPFRARETRDGFYVQTWRAKDPKRCDKWHDYARFSTILSLGTSWFKQTLSTQTGINLWFLKVPITGKIFWDNLFHLILFARTHHSTSI